MTVDNQTPERDALLVQRFQQGDRYAYDRLVEIYYPQVSRTVSRMFTDSERVNDVTQAIFIRLYKALPNLKAGVTLVAFLYQIVKFVCADEIKRKQRYARQRVFSELDDPEASVPSLLDQLLSDDTPHTYLLQQEQQRAVQQAVQEIPPPYQLPFVLFELLHCSLQEVAERLQIPVGTVKSRLSRAREHFAKHILAARELFGP